ncbi:MAG: replication initiator protein A [Lachnospiraceae bacterium]|nr:replication initiator protein A [Lachnospiraceae bacterium]
MECYFMQVETQLPIYYPLPKFILKLKISSTAKILYSLLLNRMNLSQKNAWEDESGNVFIVYPLEELARDMDRGMTAIKTALNELGKMGLVERVRPEFGRANHLYVKIPQDVDMVGKPPVVRSENRLSVGQKTVSKIAGFQPPNNNTKLLYGNNQREIGYVDYSYEEGESL